jgi:hypothetical protein
MSNPEIEALQAVDGALAILTDPAARERVLRWAWAKHLPQHAAPDGQGTLPPAGAGHRDKKTRALWAGTTKAKPRVRTGLSTVRDLNLKPSGKKSFRDFAAEKQPASNLAKSVVAVYCLRHELGLSAGTVDHVVTCFKDASWRVPSYPANTLAETASRKGWLDTRSMADIRVTTPGENLIEHDLPSSKSKE